MPKKKRPSQASGLATGPSKRQKAPPAKHPWEKGYKVGKKVVGALNPFD